MELMSWLKKAGKQRRAKMHKILDALALESSVNHQMVQNLYAEHHLKKSDWDELYSVLNAAPPETQAFERAIKDFCRSRTLIGRVSQLKSPVSFGRAVPLEVLCDILVKEGLYVDTMEAQSSIEAAIGLPIESLPEYWKNHPIGRFLMWSTFNPGGDRPFGEPEPLASEILCVLGIPPIDGGGPLLLLEYQLPKSLEARAPTVCDAYAGDFWFRYFRPVQAGKSYGQTMPTDTCPDQQGRPEVVHGVITAASLERPLRYAR